MGLGTEKTKAFVTVLIADLNEADKLRREHFSRESAAHKRAMWETKQQFNRDLKSADRQYETRKSDAERKRDDEIGAADKKYPALLASIAKKREDDLNRLNVDYPAKLPDI